MNNRRTFLKTAALSAASAVIPARGHAEQAVQPRPALTPNSIPTETLPQHFDVEPASTIWRTDIGESCLARLLRSMPNRCCT